MLIAALAPILCAVAAPAFAQNDLSTIGISAPVSACAMTSTETVTVTLFNYGSTLPAGTSFNVAYFVNAGAPVVELLTLGTALISNSRLNYTFTTQANLSVPGSYSVVAMVALAGDINPTNDALMAAPVLNSAPSVGGIVSGVSGPTLSGNQTLSGHTGSVLGWQQSDDGGFRWRRLANSTTVQAFDQLREHTQFRALVGNGPCAPTLSAPHTVLSSDPLFYSGFEP
ncbi:MAG: hypothetical protein ABI411_20320 [Tahibacter sp.]